MKLLPIEYSVRNLGRSPVRTGLSLLGCAIVVLLVVAAAGFVRGMQESLRRSGSPHNVILLSAGSEESIERSEIMMRVPGLASAAIPGIRRVGGVACVSPEVHLMLQVATDPEDRAAPQTALRGVTETAWLVHAGLRILHGRAPAPGANEMLLGRRAAERLGLPADGRAVGRTLYLDRRPWTVCGVFTAPGTVIESEIWCPLTPLQIAARKEQLSVVILAMEGRDHRAAEIFARQRLDLELSAVGEERYYAGLAAFFGPVRLMVYATALLVFLSGLLGGLNTMYAAVAARSHEFGTLRAIGFRRGAVLLSLLAEGALLGAAGSLLALAVALPALSGLAVPFSNGSFGLLLDAPVILAALLTGLLLGAGGAIPPAWRSLRRPIPETLKR